MVGGAKVSKAAGSSLLIACPRKSRSNKSNDIIGQENVNKHTPMCRRSMLGKDRRLDGFKVHWRCDSSNGWQWRKQANLNGLDRPTEESRFYLFKSVDSDSREADTQLSEQSATLKPIRVSNHDHNMNVRSNNNNNRNNDNNHHHWRVKDSFGALTTASLILLISMISITWISSFTGVVAVDCFKCSSRNGSNPACEDPFHNLNTTRITSPVAPDPQPNVIYHTPCYAGKKGREGLFPASACIKLTGVFDSTGETLVVRHCALDSGTLTQDTELARMSHCGKFQFDGDLLKGCVLACPDDACNSANSLIQYSHKTVWILLPFSSYVALLALTSKRDISPSMTN